MNDIILKVLETAVTAIIAVAARYLIPLLAAKLKDSRHRHAAMIAMMAVRAAEQLIREAGAGEKKYEMAVSVMKSWGLKLTDDQLQDLIEAAVQTMNAELDHLPMFTLQFDKEMAGDPADDPDDYKNEEQVTEDAPQEIAEGAGEE